MPLPFDDFYSIYSPYVERVIRATVDGISSEQVEDLAQNTFLRAWQAYERVQPGVEKTWIARIARNVAIDYLRALCIRQRYKVEWSDTMMEKIPETDNAGPALDDDQVDTLVQALERVKQKDREALLLWSQGYKTGEIATHLGLGYSACEKCVLRAKGQLREHYLALCG